MRYRGPGRRPVGARLPVLMYHSVSELPTGPLRTLAVPPRRLAEQLGTLVGAGYRLVGLTEALDLLDAADEVPPVVALTFDDGYANFLTEAVPLLAEADASATLYPAVGHLGNGPAAWLGRWATAFGPLLTWPQLREVAAAGRVEIGNHGLRHHPLDVLPARSLTDEIAASRDRLEQELGTGTRSFCYPHGYHDRQVRTLVRRAGYQNACEVGRRSYRPSTDDRLAVPRLQPTPDHSGADLLALVRGGGPRLVPQAKRLAQPAWRITRRVARRYGRQLT
ncbi:polysaccharide deacetylase family protein [Micromonospora matsumotoense]|uniref:polysaccharide deacetylase family protein n=1 Tax=Micromonospora matsumotoense TaxID=121616 RepID=UPI003D9315A0